MLADSTCYRALPEGTGPTWAHRPPRASARALAYGPWSERTNAPKAAHEMRDESR